MQLRIATFSFETTILTKSFALFAFVLSFRETLGSFALKALSFKSVFSKTASLTGIVFSKLVRINNYQTRAISLETGLRNSALAMTIALLLQDSMGYFYSSMFVTSGLFGLVMYLAGVISIFLYKPLLPVSENNGKSDSGSE